MTTLAGYISVLQEYRQNWDAGVLSPNHVPNFPSFCGFEV